MKSKEKKGFKFILGINFKRFLFLIVQTLAVLAIILLINLGGSFLRSKFDLKVDLSPGGFNSLSPQTVNYLKNYDGKIKFLFCGPQYNYLGANANVDHLDEISRGIAQANPNFEVKNMRNGGKELKEELKGVKMLDYMSHISHPMYGDEYTNGPAAIIMIDKSDVNHLKGIRLNCEDFQFGPCSNPACLKYDEYVKLNESKKGEAVSATKKTHTSAFVSERCLVGALEKLNDKNSIRIVSTTGHGERDFSMNSMFMGSIGAKIEKVNLSSGKISPDKQMLLIASPRSDFSDEELEKVKAFLNDGGRLIYCPSVMQKPAEKLEEYLQKLGIHLSEGVVLDVAKEKASALLRVDLKDQNNAYVKGMVEKNEPLVVNGCRPMVLKDAQDGWQLFEVCKTPASCITITKETADKINELRKGEKSQFTVVGGAQKDMGSGKTAKVVVVSAVDMLNGFGASFSDRHGQQDYSVGDRCFTSNANFIYSLLKETSGQQVFDYVPMKKTVQSSHLDFGFDEQGKKLPKDKIRFRKMMFTGVILSLPFAFLLMAVIMIIIRRRKK